MALHGKLAERIAARDRLSAKAVPARGQVLAAAMMAIVMTATEGSIVITPAGNFFKFAPFAQVVSTSGFWGFR